MYHRVLPKSDFRLDNEEPGMYVTPETLNIHLSKLSQITTFISIEDWLHLSKNNQLDNTPYCAITFDDGWADNYEFALPLLKKYKAPATIFLATNYIDSNSTFWPERLYGLLNRFKEGNNANLLSHLNNFLALIETTLDQTQLKTNTSEYAAKLIDLAKILSDDEINSSLDKIEESLPATKDTSQDMLNWEQITEMKEHGLEIGGHTRSHLRLNIKASNERVRQEVAGCAKDIENQLGMQPTLFCYPNGDTSENAVSIVKQNFHAAVTTQNGVNIPGAEPFLLKRTGVHEDISNSHTKFLAALFRSTAK